MNLAERMRNYENVNRSYLTNKVPVIIRVDGRAFHTFTRGLRKPYDPIMIKAMNKTTLDLVKEIQNCVVGYTQSDEISLLLLDDENLETCSWFKNNINKIVSISASLASTFFDRNFRSFAEDYINGVTDTEDIENESDFDFGDEIDYYFDDKLHDKYIGDEYKRTLKYKSDIIKVFDSRAFNIPKEDVTNYFFWRQRDAISNSKQSFGQAFLPRKKLFKTKTSEIVEMLRKEGIDWDSRPDMVKRGLFWVKSNLGDRKEFRASSQELVKEGRDLIESIVLRGEKS